MKNLLLFTLLLLFQSSYSQVRHYGTRDYIEFLKSKESAVKPFSGDRTEIKLPVTLSLNFILLTKDVSKDQLLKQITVLNQDFSNETFELSESKSQFYEKLAVDTEIRFCESFEVIEAYTDEKMDFTLCQEYARKFNQINKNSILIFVTSLDKMAGYAQMPGYDAETDAIFIDKSYLFGQNSENYNLGKTLTHLVGSYLGLGELWGCEDDGVSDTPMHNTPSTDNSDVLSTCYEYVVHTMPQNFMDNTYDKFLTFFTPGQKHKMLFEISTRRINLYHTNCTQK